jgi:hypothetical protein
LKRIEKGSTKVATCGGPGTERQLPSSSLMRI